MLDELDALAIEHMFVDVNAQLGPKATASLARLCATALPQISGNDEVVLLPSDLVPTKVCPDRQNAQVSVLQPRFRTSKRNCTNGMRQLARIEEPQLQLPTDFACGLSSGWRELLSIMRRKPEPADAAMANCMQGLIDSFDRRSGDGSSPAETGFDWLEIGVGYEDLDKIIFAAKALEYVERIDVNFVAWDILDAHVLLTYREELQDRYVLEPPSADEDVEPPDLHDLSDIVDIQLPRRHFHPDGLFRELPADVSAHLRRFSDSVTARWPHMHYSEHAACDLFGAGVDSFGFDTIFRRYTRCHRAVVAKEAPPRFLVFRWVTPAGWGNIFGQLVNAFLLALFTRRALLVDFPLVFGGKPMEAFLSAPPFNWDFDSVRLSYGALEFDALRTAGTVYAFAKRVHAPSAAWRQLLSVAVILDFHCRISIGSWQPQAGNYTQICVSAGEDKCGQMTNSHAPVVIFTDPECEIFRCTHRPAVHCHASQNRNRVDFASSQPPGGCMTKRRP